MMILLGKVSKGDFGRWKNREWGNLWESLDICIMLYAMEPGNGAWITIRVSIASGSNIPITTETGLRSGSLSSILR